MTSELKEFIEYNLRFIKEKNYYKAFEDWYYVTAPSGRRHDRTLIEQLFNMFKKIGIDVKTESEEAREQLIFDMCVDQIERNDESMEPDKLQRSVIVNLLSFLGFEEVHVKSIFKDAYLEVRGQEYPE